MKVLQGSEGWEGEGNIHIINTGDSPQDVIQSICPTKVSEEAFYVVDLDNIIKKINLWKINLPRVELFYAVKCNNTEKIIQLLAAAGTNFDCASKGEIEQVLGAGVSADRIIYANPCKTRSYISHANKVGVNMMTFDNEAELIKVKDKHPHAEMVLRIKADALDSQCVSFGVKFGADLSAVPGLLSKALELGVSVVGVSFHVGSGCRDGTAFPRAIAAARGVFTIAEKLGIHMKVLDIGGGYPGHDDGNLTFTQLSEGINSSLDQHFPEGCGVRIIAEPGRYVVASAFTLQANVIAKRQFCEDGDVGFMYYINDGIYGSFNCLLYDNAQVQATLPKQKAGDKYKCSIWGPTCDSLDKVVESINLPELNIGDWLMFENMGAYTVSAATTFNGFIKPALYYSIQRDTWLSLIKMDAFGDGNDSSDTEVRTDENEMMRGWVEESKRLAQILDSINSLHTGEPGEENTTCATQLLTVY